MPPAITSVTELRAEISRLRLQKKSQETKLKQHFNSPKAVLNTTLGLLRRSNQHKHIGATASLGDIWNQISKKLLSLTLDKTLFRRSNFMVRALAGIISRNAVKHVDKRSVTGWWEKLKGIVPDVYFEKSAIDEKRGIRTKRIN